MLSHRSSLQGISAGVLLLAGLLFPTLVPGTAEATQNEVFRLTASDAAAGDAFGDAVAVYGDRAVIGAPYDDHSGVMDAGSAYVFDLVTRDELFRLTADDPDSGDLFGNTVAVFGTLAVVGAPGDDEEAAQSGAAYVFDITTGEQLFKLTSPDASAEEYFGWSVALYSGIAVIGAPRNDGDATDAGAAFLFNAGTGELIWKISPGPTYSSASDRFGHAVAINADFVLIGTPYTGTLDEGVVYRAPVLSQNVLPVWSGSQPLGWVGYSVAAGKHLVSGSPNDGCGFNSGWIRPFGCSPLPGCDLDQLGWSVATVGDKILAGAPIDSLYEGSARLYLEDPFAINVPECRLQSVLMPAEKQTGDRFGDAVAMTLALGLVGAPNYNGGAVNMGAVYAFDVSLPTPVHLLRTAARREGGTAVVEWEIAESGGLAGFHVHRQEAPGARVRLTVEPLRGGTRFRFTDPHPPASETAYWLQELDRTGDTAWHGPILLPAAASLPVLSVGRPHPNPFFGATRLRYTLNRGQRVEAAVFDLQGRRVKTLVDRVQPPGEYEILWDGTARTGARVPVGIYLIRMRAGSRERTQKVALLPQG